MPDITEAPQQKRKAELLYKILVGMSAPLILGVYWNWLATRDTIGDLEHAIEKQQLQIKALEDKMDEGDRFTQDEGDAMQSDVDRNTTCCSLLREARTRHDNAATHYITTIDRNTPIILENQRKAHTHNGNGK